MTMEAIDATRAQLRDEDPARFGTGEIIHNGQVFESIHAVADAMIWDALADAMAGLGAAAAAAARRFDQWNATMLAAYGIRPGTRAAWKKLRRRILADEQWRPAPLIHNGRKPRT